MLHLLLRAVSHCPSSSYVPFPVVPHFPSCPISQHASLLLIPPPATLCLLLSSVSHCFSISLCSPSPIMPRPSYCAWPALFWSLWLFAVPHTRPAPFRTLPVLFLLPSSPPYTDAGSSRKTAVPLKIGFQPPARIPSSLSVSFSSPWPLTYSNGSSLCLPHCHGNTTRSQLDCLRAVLLVQKTVWGHMIAAHYTCVS